MYVNMCIYKYIHICMYTFPSAFLMMILDFLYRTMTQSELNIEYRPTAESCFEFMYVQFIYVIYYIYIYVSEILRLNHGIGIFILFVRTSLPCQCLCRQTKTPKGPRST